MGWIVLTKIMGITVADKTEKIRFPLPSQYYKNRQVPFVIARS